jgi:hypothetical protein
VKRDLCLCRLYDPVGISCISIVMVRCPFGQRGMFRPLVNVGLPFSVAVVRITLMRVGERSLNKRQQEAGQDPHVEKIAQCSDFILLSPSDLNILRSQLLGSSDATEGFSIEQRAFVRFLTRFVSPYTRTRSARSNKPPMLPCPAAGHAMPALLARTSVSRCETARMNPVACRGLAQRPHPAPIRYCSTFVEFNQVLAVLFAVTPDPEPRAGCFHSGTGKRSLSHSDLRPPQRNTPSLLSAYGRNSNSGNSGNSGKVRTSRE